MGIESKIRAITGFQSRGFTKDELVPLFIQVLNTPEKKIEYIMGSLTSSKEIYKNGGHVVMKGRDQIFRLHFDNRRRIMSEDCFEQSEDCFEQSEAGTKTKTKTKNETEKSFNLVDYTPCYSVGVFESSESGGNNQNVDSYVLLDSRPVKNVTESSNFRYLMKLSRNSNYNKETSGSGDNNYKGTKDKFVRSFLKGLLHTPPKFNLNNDFSSYADIITYLQEFDPTIKLTKSGISRLKNRKMIFRTVPRNVESLKFVDFIRLKYPDFDVDAFLEK